MTSGKAWQVPRGVAPKKGVRGVWGTTKVASSGRPRRVRSSRPRRTRPLAGRGHGEATFRRAREGPKRKNPTTALSARPRAPGARASRPQAPTTEDPRAHMRPGGVGGFLAAPPPPPEGRTVRSWWTPVVHSVRRGRRRAAPVDVRSPVAEGPPRAVAVQPPSTRNGERGCAVVARCQWFGRAAAVPQSNERTAAPLAPPFPDCALLHRVGWRPPLRPLWHPPPLPGALSSAILSAAAPTVNR